ncbi:hypothetical protein AGLY_005779 [Aphis glycines]|uniref:Uncharacterized protein n=1 Tax=Aphis glycines TaxID=307491 RepID=A0A6G0TV18_APHGL|nr:hypothetical protein AGLY_005779 [Aphis glycines]
MYSCKNILNESSETLLHSLDHQGTGVFLGCVIVFPMDLWAASVMIEVNCFTIISMSSVFNSLLSIWFSDIVLSTMSENSVQFGFLRFHLIGVIASPICISTVKIADHYIRKNHTIRIATPPLARFGFHCISEFIFQWKHVTVSSFINILYAMSSWLIIIDVGLFSKSSGFTKICLLKLIICVKPSILNPALSLIIGDTKKRPLDTREAYVMSFGEINLERAIRYSICGIFSIVLNTMANSLFGSCSEDTFDAKLGVFVLCHCITSVDVGVELRNECATCITAECRSTISFVTLTHARRNRQLAFWDI